MTPLAHGAIPPRQHRVQVPDSQATDLDTGGAGVCAGLPVPPILAVI